MKAKTLLIAAAALAAGVMHSQAQVYSQNIVGYINVPINTGYNMIANQLDLDGTGTNNTVISVLGTNSLPAGSAVLTWTGTNFITDSFSVPRGKTQAVWASTTTPLSIGQGFFVVNPGPPTNIVEVGNVFTGTNVNPFLASAGYSAVGSVSPVAGDLITNLDYTPSVGDAVELFNNSATNYTTYNYSIPRGKTQAVWAPGVPQISVAQGFFITTTNRAPVWTEILNVQ